MKKKIKQMTKKYLYNKQIKAKCRQGIACIIVITMIGGFSGYSATFKPVNAASYTPIELDVEDHSQEDIEAFVKTHPVDFNIVDTYKVTPSTTSPYRAGVLSNESIQNALNLLNQFRYIAGLKSDVVTDEQYSNYSSAGSLISYLNNGLDHEGPRPEGMSADDPVYIDGKKGCADSNIGGMTAPSGYTLNMKTTNLPAFLKLWLGDTDSSNIKILGHRRWLLSPKLETTGFGLTYDTSKAYSAMYTASGKSGTSDVTTVAWPAVNTPAMYFKATDAWSVGFDKYLLKECITVKLTRKSDKKTWNFSSESSNGEFYVNNNSYGSLTSCVIFKPDTLAEIKAGDVFNVTVNNEADHTQLTYDVTFFDMNLVVKGGIDANGNSWSIDGAGTLTISGNHKMVDYEKSSGAPWYAMRANIKKVVVDGPSYIGQFAFAGMTNLKELQIGNSVEMCGASIVPGATNLKTLRIPASVKSLDLALYNTNLTEIIFEGDPPEIYEKEGLWKKDSDQITIYYKGANEKWTQDKLLNYGAENVQWVSYCYLDEDGSIKNHTFSKEIIAPQCDQNGYTKYSCDNCEYSYQDAEVPALGHSYESPKFLWSKDNTNCSVMMDCSECGDSLSAMADVKVTKDVLATCEEPGIMEYTATAVIADKTYTDIKQIKSEALGHKYLPIEIVWSEDFTVANAEKICKNGCEKNYTYACTVSKEETLATCTQEGSIVYTATVSIDGNEKKDIKTIVIAKLDHEYEAGVCKSCGCLFEVEIDGLIYSAVLDGDSTDENPKVKRTFVYDENGTELDALVLGVKANPVVLQKEGTKIAVVKDRIPSNEKEFPYVVAEVEAEGFSGTMLDSVIFPDTLEKVNANAFKDSTITKVEFLNKLAPTLDPDAFSGSKVTMVTIPIGASGYEGQDALKNMKGTITIKEVASPTYPGQKPTPGTESGTGTATGTGTETGTVVTPGTTTSDIPTGITAKPSGTKVTYKKLKYEVVSDSTNSFAVIFTGPASKKVKTITIPAYIVIDNIKYNVIGIKANAFKGCKKLKTIKIKSKKFKNAKIAKKAFKGLKKKVKVKVPKSKSKTYKKWFEKKSLPKKVKVSKL